MAKDCCWTGHELWGYCYLALDHNNPSFVVNANTARVLQDIRPKLPHKLPVLVVDLNLVCRRPEKAKFLISLNVSFKICL